MNHHHAYVRCHMGVWCARHRTDVEAKGQLRGDSAFPPRWVLRTEPSCQAHKTTLLPKEPALWSKDTANTDMTPKDSMETDETAGFPQANVPMAFKEQKQNILETEKNSRPYNMYIFWILIKNKTTKGIFSTINAILIKKT